MPNLNINGQNMSVEAASDTPLLWVIREQLQMTGTKFGCGAGLCGACTVHLNGEAVRSCQTSVGDAARQEDHHHRRSERQGRSSRAEGLGRRAGAAMRLLPVRADHAGGIAAVQEHQSDQGDRRADGRQSLPLHDLFAHSRRSCAPRPKCAPPPPPAPSGGPHEQARENRSSGRPPICPAARSSSAPPSPASRSAIRRARLGAGRRARQFDPSVWYRSRPTVS